MKTLLLLRTELRQNAVQWLAVATACLALGLVLHVAMAIENQLSVLSEAHDWNADLVVIPKGITLKGLEREILTGVTTAFLPRALFETTEALAKGQFEVQAILPDKTDGTIRLLTWGAGKITSTWAFAPHTTTGVQNSIYYSTPEWGPNVIAAFFAKGSPQSMTTLKELIDRKTVAQAFFVSEQLAEERLLKDKIDHALVLAITVFIALFVSLALVSFVWLRQAFTQISGVLFEIGFAQRHILRLQFVIALVLILLPALIGFLLAPGIDIH